MAKQTALADRDLIDTPKAAAILSIPVSELLDFAKSDKDFPKPNAQGFWSLRALTEFRGPADVEAVSTADTSAKVDQPESVVSNASEDPHLRWATIEVPSADSTIARSTVVAVQFGTQWRRDEMAMIARLVSGLIRIGATYTNHALPPKEQQVRVTNTPDAIRWLLRRAVPLTLDELREINGVHKVPHPVAVETSIDA